MNSKSTINSKPIKLIQILWKTFSTRRKFQFYGLLILSTIASFSEIISIGLVVPYLGILTSPDIFFENIAIQPLIIFFEIKTPNQLILPLTIIFIIAVLMSGLMRMILLWFQTRMSHIIGADLSYDIYRKSLYQPYMTHLNRNSSEIISSITIKVNNVVYNTILPGLRIFSSILISFSILLTLLLIEPILFSTSILIFAFIYLVLILNVRKKLSSDSLIVSTEQDKVIKSLQEGLGGIRDVLINGSQEVYAKEFNNADLSLRKAQANIHIIGGIPRFGIESLAITLLVILAYFISSSSSGIILAIPALGSLALGAAKILPLFQLVYLSWSSFRGGIDSLKDVIDLMNQNMPSKDELSHNIMPLQFKQSLVLKDITFKYDNSEKKIIENLDIEILKGERIGIIGETGSGKSTFLDIIMGLIVPTKGQILVDGVEIKKNNRRNWQRHIAHVPQNIFLADNSISENIAFGIKKNQIDFEKIKKAAQNAQISSKIESLPDKYNTNVGERGVRLSGGQLQRIGIARAIYKNSDFIVFDEATSALDNTTEEKLVNTISNMNSTITMIIVAHRMSSLKYCSRVYKISNGTINIVNKDSLKDK